MRHCSSLTICSWKIITRRGSSIFNIFSLEDELKHTNALPEKRGSIERLYSLVGDQVGLVRKIHHLLSPHLWAGSRASHHFSPRDTSEKTVALNLRLFDLILGIAGYWKKSISFFTDFSTYAKYFTWKKNANYFRELFFHAKNHSEKKILMCKNLC